MRDENGYAQAADKRLCCLSVFLLGGSAMAMTLHNNPRFDSTSCAGDDSAQEAAAPVATSFSMQTEGNRRTIGVMGVVEIIFGVAVPVLIGIGMTLATMGHAHRREFWIARACFAVAGCLTIGLTFQRLSDLDWAPIHRILVGLLITITATIAMVTGVRWVGLREIALPLATAKDHNVTSYGQSGGITAHTVHGAEGGGRDDQ